MAYGPFVASLAGCVRRINLSGVPAIELSAQTLRAAMRSAHTERPILIAGTRTASSEPTRAAKNQALFREVNERVADVAEDFELPQLRALCECSLPGCAAMFEITHAEYEGVRAHGERFAMISGHEETAVERVVGRNARFIVVEKIGARADVARDLDPRS